MLEEWLRMALADASGVTAWPLQASELQEPPFIVYARQATERERVLDGPAPAPVATFEVMIFAEGFQEVRALAAKVRVGVPNFKGGPAGTTILDIWLEDESDGEPVEFPGDEKPWHVAAHTWVVRYIEEN